MWSSFMETGKVLAEKAKAAAVDLDSKINETVGIDDDGAFARKGKGKGKGGGASSGGKEGMQLLQNRESTVLEEDVWGDEYDDGDDAFLDSTADDLKKNQQEATATISDTDDAADRPQGDENAWAENDDEVIDFENGDSAAAAASVDETTKDPPLFRTSASEEQKEEEATEPLASPLEETTTAGAFGPVSTKGQRVANEKEEGEAPVTLPAASESTAAEPSQAPQQEQKQQLAPKEEEGEEPELKEATSGDSNNLGGEGGWAEDDMMEDVEVQEEEQAGMSTPEAKKVVTNPLGVLASLAAVATPMAALPLASKRNQQQQQSQSSQPTTGVADASPDAPPPRIEAAHDEPAASSPFVVDEDTSKATIPIMEIKTAVVAEHMMPTTLQQQPPTKIPHDADGIDNENDNVADAHRHMRLRQELESQQEITRILEQRLDEVTSQLEQREDQLVSKTQQLSVLQADWETERSELQSRISQTKEEAKRRIQKAKERVEVVEAKIKAVSMDDQQQAEVIAALRSEGERLAHKQAEMEKAVRTAKSESRELREKLEDETQEKMDALATIEKFQAELKATKENLASARRGESQADKLEADLSHAREELERKGSTILSLEQQIKELKAEIKELIAELEDAREGAAMDSQMQQEKLLRHHDDSVKDLEQKLRSTEREAAVREDALRHEVDELRKRWQDAVRRADTLSMDIQSSTAPLMRQLESAERQSRVRAAAAAEIETKLRSELEETVISNEKLTKERTELKTKANRLERKEKEAEEELRSTKLLLEEKTTLANQLEERLHSMEIEGARMKKEWAEVERLANEGVTRVRSEMTQTVVDSEERYRSQLDALKKELVEEQDKTKQLEEQVRGLLDNIGTIGVTPTNSSQQHFVVSERKPRRLLQSEGQEDILAGALGLGGQDEDDEDGDEVVDHHTGFHRQQSESFAALEELSSRLKAAKVEVDALRKSLAESEKTRERLVQDLVDSRNAKEKLPLFEAKVKELTEENQEQALEIMGLREDIDEIRELYRSQLNMLLEEKARLVLKQHDNGGIVETSRAETHVVVEADPAEATASAEEDNQ